MRASWKIFIIFYHRNDIIGALEGTLIHCFRFWFSLLPLAYYVTEKAHSLVGNGQPHTTHTLKTEIDVGIFLCSCTIWHVFM